MIYLFFSLTATRIWEISLQVSWISLQQAMRNSWLGSSVIMLKYARSSLHTCRELFYEVLFLFLPKTKKIQKGKKSAQYLYLKCYFVIWINDYYWSISEKYILLSALIEVFTFRMLLFDFVCISQEKNVLFRFGF